MRRAIYIFTMLSMLAACGTRGPLYLPDKTHPKTPAPTTEAPPPAPLPATPVPLQPPQIQP